MMICRLMAAGSITPSLVMYGSQLQCGAFVLTVLTGIGYGQMNMNGYGFLIMIGVGHLFTTAAGAMTLTTAGYGYRDTNGLLHG